MHAQDPIESGVEYQNFLFQRVKDRVVPVIRNLDSTQKPYLFVKSFEWSKTDNKYERERRYFNSNSFTPYVLGNVYNCTIKTTYMVPFLYPGMIVALQPYLGTQDDVKFEKGSITINGVSLTVIDSKDYNFSVAIIPYTYENTNFKNLKEGSLVNLEFDMIGKYIKKLHGELI